MLITRRQIFLLAALALMPCFASGCGGGGGGGSTTRLVIPRLTIRWPERGRATSAFASARSVLVTLKSAGANNQDIPFIINRLDTSQEYTQTYPFPTQAKVGTWRLEANFHAESNASGAIVGTGAGSVTMDTQGNLPDIATQGRIAQVEILSGQSVPVGEDSDLAFRAVDAGGSIIPITSGSLKYAITQGADKIRVEDGYLLGIAPGIATVVPSVDGITGPPQVVVVTSNASLSVTPDNPTVEPGGTINFQPTVTNAPNTAVTWSVDEGAAGGTITANGVYTAPNTNGIYHVTCTSVYDPNKWRSIVITVAGGGADVGVDFPPSGGADVIID